MLSLRNSYHAGDQNKFIMPDAPKKETTIRHFGCGLVGLADLILYLEDNRKRNQGGEEKSSGKSGISAKAYDSFLNLLDNTVAKVHRLTGLNGFSLSHGFNRFADRNALPFKAHWGVPQKKLLEEVRFMLDRDIPVILSIGPDLVPWRKNKGVLFLSDRPEKHPEGALVSDHYVTVTGLLEMEGKTYLRVASWGKQYYMDFSEYTRYVKSQPPVFGSLFSNILLVTPVRSETP